jgi:fatty-acyl-CoA synthase
VTLTSVSGTAYWPIDDSYPFVEAAIGDVLRERAASGPDRPAVYCDDHGRLATLTYAELLHDATRLAHRLLAMAQPGARIATWTPNSADWVVLHYASVLAGMIVVPLNPVFTDRELRDIVERSDASVLFTVDSFRGSNLIERARACLSDRQAFTVEDLSRWRDLPAAESALPVVDPSAPYLIQFTSGTTGKPKGAVLSHRAAYNNAHLRALLLQPGDHEVWCSPTGFYHVAGSVSRVLGALSANGAVVVIAEPKARVMLDMMERTRTTHAGLIGKLALDALEDETLADRDLSSLTSLALGGTAAAPHLFEQLQARFGVAIVNGYGQSESPHITGTRVDDSLEDRLTTIGRPLPHREVCIRRIGTQEIAAVGETGEICTRGPLVMDGYFRDSVGTAATIDSDGWLNTGDLGSMDERGVLTFRGRTREVIIRGGENVYPQEIEHVLDQAPGVAEAVVVGTAHPLLGEEVTAVVRAEPGTELDAEALSSFVAAHLAGFKVPKRWAFVSDLPRTASGKIQKNKVKEQVSASFEGSVQ